MPDSAIIVTADATGIAVRGATHNLIIKSPYSHFQQEQARSIIKEAGSDPSDYHFSSQVEIATESIQNGKSREEILQEVIDNLATKRDRVQVEAETEAKELRSAILRMGKKRVKIDDLEKRLRDLGPANQGFNTDVERASFMMKKDDLERRLKVERESMKRDEDFARNIMLKIGGELNGL